MSTRFRCRACQTAFVSHDDQVGRPITCPKCGAKQGTAPPTLMPKPAAPVAVAPSEESVFVPADDAKRPRRLRRMLAVGLVLLLVAGVAVVVALPTLRRWWHPVPPDPVETVATAYLHALVDGDSEATRRLGTVDLPPAIRTFRAVRRDRSKNSRLRGSFAPITAFHARVNETYTYDPSSGRYLPKNPLGPAAETLDALHDAKAKAEAEGLAKKIASGDPEDLFDAAEGMAKTFSNLAETVLAPKKLIPTYKRLVDDAKPPLPPAERTLALDFASRHETWDALLKRSYTTLKADGPFILDRAEISASIVEGLGSLGDPPTPLYLTLTRFRLEGIDTGWKVTETRRAGQPAAPAPEPSPPPSTPRPSPGETPIDRPYQQPLSIDPTYQQPVSK
jgi:hypothetical protein